MKPTILLACLLFAAFPAATFGSGEKQYSDYNFAITPPDDWLDTTATAGQKGVIASFGSPDHTRTVFVLVEERPVPAGELDARFVVEFDRAAEPQLGKRLFGKFVMVQGIKSYERTSAPVVRGKTVSLIMRTTLVGTRFYSIQAYRFTGGDAEDDPQIRAMLDSFHFLTPPATASVATAATAAQPARPPPAISIAFAQPTPALRAESQPAPAADPAIDNRAKDLEDAFRRGQAVGRALAVLLIVGVPVLVIVWFARRGKRRGPGVPPPSRPKPASGPPQPSAPPAPPKATPAPVSPPPLPAASPASPAPPSTTPAPSPAPQTRPFVIRPRQRHMRG